MVILRQLIFERSERLSECKYCLVRHLYYDAWKDDSMIEKRMKQFKCPFMNYCNGLKGADNE